MFTHPLFVHKVFIWPLPFRCPSCHDNKIPLCWVLKCLVLVISHCFFRLTIKIKKVVWNRSMDNLFQCVFFFQYDNVDHYCLLFIAMYVVCHTVFVQWVTAEENEECKEHFYGTCPISKPVLGLVGCSQRLDKYPSTASSTINPRPISSEKVKRINKEKLQTQCISANELKVSSRQLWVHDSSSCSAAKTLLHCQFSHNRQPTSAPPCLF